MPRTRWTFLPPLLVAVLCALLGPAPAPAQEVPVYPGGIDVVNVTVTVRDAQGHLVSNLGRDNFVIYEDGKALQARNVQVFAPAAQEGNDQPLGLNLGMLMDTSESMKAQISLSQQSAVRFLESIPRARDLLLIFFDQDIRLSRYNDENQQGLFERILGMKGSGNTALYDAISVYLSRIADSPGRKVLVIFTDGDDTTSATSLGETMALVRSSGVTVYPIAFTGNAGLGTNRNVSARAILNTLAGQVGVAGHLKIGDGVIATAQTGIPSDVGPGTVISGYPAIPNREWLKASAVFPRLPELLRRLRALEKRLGGEPPEEE